MRFKKLLQKISIKKILLTLILTPIVLYIIVFLLFLRTQRLSLFTALNSTFINSYHATLLDNPELFFKTMMPGTDEYTWLQEHLDQPEQVNDYKNEFREERTSSSPLPYELFYDFMSEENEASEYNWHWKDDMLVGQVISSDKSQDLLGLSVTIPALESQTWVSDKSTFRVNCEKPDSILVGENLFLKTTFIDFLDEVQAGDRVYAFCMNEECSEIGRSCVIARNE